jgi:cyclopropane-fatty-acyl-phospholipid synthase
LGLDDRFARLWNFYLAYCEAGFEERDISTLQFVMAKPGWTPSQASVSASVRCDARL